MCGATFEQMKILVDAGFIEAMIALLETIRIEKILLMTMESLEGCLVAFNTHFGKPQYAQNPWVAKMEELGGLNCLESIQALPSISDTCHTMAADFVIHFWGDEDSVGNESETNNDNGNDNNSLYFDSNTQLSNEHQSAPYLF
ncbi:hypothetical protein RFI_13559 [Reticulomyxa filosa]|uniref:Uncharacterized protein n=1 Tax=Reticulomyxa filosa TaxID=46433 RepID=X6NC62_RETFI|nr:hypothetical protein RFI_13559 [Reticulomyxa filosa]|eukprot:ETO23621.1 hypothetical protein RFI_13559 [Reticulomyxa filosa]